MEKYENNSVETNFTGKDVCCEKGLMPATLGLNMLILTAEDVLKTYPDYEAESARKYFEYLKLKENNPTFGYKRLAKMLGVPIARTRCWKQWSGKPTSILAVEKLTEAKLLPLNSDNPKFPAILRLLAAGFTDGGIDANMNTFHFNSAVKQNIDAWKTDFEYVFPFAKDSLSYIVTGKYGSSIGVRTCERAVIRFFAALGCPVGNKTMVSYSLPNWLFQLKKELKIAFIDGFFSCEVAMPQYSISRKAKHFVNFSLSMSKILEKEVEHIKFLKEFCKLCAEIGIKHTTIGCVLQKPKRKDGRTCDSYRILFSNSAENVLRAHKLFPLTYAIEKKKRFDQAVKSYLERFTTTPIKTSSATIPIDAFNNLPEGQRQESSQAQSLVL